jgi:hypothetical protein
LTFFGLAYKIKSKFERGQDEKLDNNDYSSNREEENKEF